jgi:hypothetical protein
MEKRGWASPPPRVHAITPKTIRSHREYPAIGKFSEVRLIKVRNYFIENQYFFGIALPLFIFRNPKEQQPPPRVWQGGCWRYIEQGKHMLGCRAWPSSVAVMGNRDQFPSNYIQSLSHSVQMMQHM